MPWTSEDEISSLLKAPMGFQTLHLFTWINPKDKVFDLRWGKWLTPSIDVCNLTFVWWVLAISNLNIVLQQNIQIFLNGKGKDFGSIQKELNIWRRNVFHEANCVPSWDCLKLFVPPSKELRLFSKFQDSYLFLVIKEWK